MLQKYHLLLLFEIKFKLIFYHISIFGWQYSWAFR